MALSAELARFFADHATSESWAAFANGIGTPPTAANLAAAMSAKGYRVGEAEVVAGLEFAKQSALADHQLDGVVGGQATTADADMLNRLMAQMDATIASRSTTADADMINRMMTQLDGVAKQMKDLSNSQAQSMAKINRG